MIASLAAASLFLSCETALAGEVVQGGVFESLGYDPTTATKQGVQLSKKTLKSAFGPAPEVSKPKAAPKKSPPPAKKPAKPAAKPTSKPVPKPAEEPSGRKKLVESSPFSPFAKKKAPPAPKPAETKPAKTKPAKTKSIKKTVVKAGKPTPLPSVKAPEVKLPKVSLPTVPPLSTTNRDATEAGIVLGVEVLLALIASSTVTGILKKA